jgi:hypothetical protein
MPTPDSPNFPAFNTHNGISKREYFAGQVLPAVVGSGFGPAVAATIAYQYADAMFGNEPATVALESLMERVQVRLDVIKPPVIMGDEDSINLTPHQVGVQYAFGEVIKMIAGVLSGAKSDGQ